MREVDYTVPFLKFVWLNGVPKVLIYSPTAMGHFTVCISLVFCVYTQKLMLWFLLEQFSVSANEYTKQLAIFCLKRELIKIKCH